jgi:small subunit ribosomal protein S18
MARDRRRSAPSDRRRTMKKKISVLTTENVRWVDYKDVNLLRRFMSERAKIRARRVTGNSEQQQRAVARAIRVAREMALLPYSVRQVTQRSKGRRDRDLAREPSPPAAPEPEVAPADESGAVGPATGEASSDTGDDASPTADAEGAAGAEQSA